MIARFIYNISRHHGKYGTSVAVFESVESMRNGGKCYEYLKTYKHQNPGDGRAFDQEAQIEELKQKIEKKYPNVEFINL